jgi:lipopolysaccharide export system permease protein
VLAFAQHDLPIRLPEMATFRKRGEGNLEATLPELLHTMVTATDATEQRSASASFNRRIVQCVIMFLLPFLALPMAVPPKRSTSALGVFLSTIALVTFHKFTEYGERMGTLGRIDPVLAQWVPFALFLGVALWLFRVLERPGGQPIGALDHWFGKITGFLSGLAGKLVRRQNWADDVLSAG